MKNFTSGVIYQGRMKMICTPGLNCYSCPAAVMSCPIGAAQLFFAGVRHSISLFVTGFVISVGVVLGRFICGYVCPMGLLQDLLYKIRFFKRVVRFRYLRYVKYFVLTVFVVLLPLLVLHELSGLGEPWFCKYICPSGTVFGAIPLLVANEFLRGFAGTLLIVKLAISAVILVTAVIIYRPFCRVLCPLGAIYALFNKIAFIKMRCDKEKCVSCGLCAEACLVKLEPSKKPNSPECVRCGDCKTACKSNALSYRR
ncbi:MAG: 4Fe-4S binding protein [Oscillospiraceae bacterium]|nr:4Fe-4S binding protein [Oscillospiraceae bacterium]